MRILILKNYITRQDVLDKGLDLAKQECTSAGLYLTYMQLNLNIPLSSIPFSNTVNPHGYEVNPSSFLGTWNIGYDSVCLVYDWSRITPQPTNPGDEGQTMQLPEQWYVNSTSVPPERVFADFFEHELCHSLAFQKGGPDLTHLLTDQTIQKDNPDLYDRFKQGQPHEWYIYYISSIVAPSASQGQIGAYKYFKDSEIVGLKTELVRKLDTARGMAGVPFFITSGYRSIAKNILVGGVSGSEHTLGIGCDILADTSEKRFRIVSGALQAGFTRIGIYINHIHLGIGKMPDFDQGVMWSIEKD